MSGRPKDRSMICRMAGNIAGPIVAEVFASRKLEFAEELSRIANLSVILALEIVQQVDRRPTDKRDACGNKVGE